LQARQKSRIKSKAEKKELPIINRFIHHITIV
jgi:hypothetical protein